MRRKIELYIAGRKADIDEKNLILYNYSLTDLQKPTAVRNSFSKQVTLPGTATNDAIFSHAYRLDRITGATGFNALSRTPFVIYDDTARILQSGYLRLDKVNRKGASHTFAVTLFGGLGEFLYNLTYDSDGNSRPLSDMDYVYINEGTPYALDLGFTINKQLVLDHWAGVDGTVTDAATAKLRALTFIPCYNGLPKAFDAGSVLFSPGAGSKGLPSYLEDEEGVMHSTTAGLALAKVEKQFDEWVMRDLRSYLQRPALNVKALLDTISQPENNGGYTIVWKSRPIREDKLFLTLKTLDLIDYSEYADEDIAESSTTGQNNAYTRQITVDGAGKKVTANIQIVQKVISDPSYYALFGAYDRYRDGSYYDTAAGAFMWQLVGYDSSNNVVAKSDVCVITNATPMKTLGENAAAAWLATGSTTSNFTPVPGSSYYVLDAHYEGGYQSGTFSLTRDPALSMTGANIVRLEVVGGWVTNAQQMGTTTPVTEYNLVTQQETAGMTYPSIARSISTSGNYTVGSTAIRTGTTLTQAQVLNSGHSIAEYFTSILKSFGMLMTCDEAKKEITVWKRNDFYTTGLDQIDLSSRIDRSKGIDIQPLCVSSLFYSFDPGVVEGGAAQRYKKDYSRNYGMQRINTNYPFNRETKNLADGVVFKTAVPYVGRGKDYTLPFIGGKGSWYFPWEQYKRTLTYGGVGDEAYSMDFDPIYPTGWMSYSPALSFADLKDKPQFCGDDGAAVSGEDCLLYLRDRSAWRNGDTDFYQVSDDCDEMFYLNGENPCWYAVFSGTDYISLVDGADVPEFSVMLEVVGGGAIVGASNLLSFGTPLEVYDPFTAWLYESNAYPLYDCFWKNYLKDMLDKDTKVMKCRVDLTGLQVGPELLRRFFWYEGSIWALNKITNYSLTTWDPVECEFIQVQDTNNYTNGQQA